MSSFVPQVVMRYLKSRRGFTRVVTLFSVLGILLGVAALIIVLAVMSGFRQELMSRILGISGHATIEIAGLETREAENLAKALEGIEGVKSATPYVTGQVMVSANGRATGAYVRGLEKLDDFKAAGVAELPPAGQLLVGHGLSLQLGVIGGDGVTLLSPEGARTIMGFIPRTGQFEVAGTFNVGMIQFDNGLVVGRMEDVQSFLRRGNRVDAVEIHLYDAQQIERLTPAILQIAGQYAGDAPLIMTPWTESNAEFFRALQVERITMFIILSLIVVVAAFNIITGQMMLVNDKMNDIAILRTMGATKAQIRRIFLLNGLLLGGLGTAGGVGLGMLAVWRMTELVNFIKTVTGVDLFPRDVYFLSALPSKLSPWDMGAIVGMTLVLTLLASLYPAWRASLLNPVELLRRG